MLHLLLASTLIAATATPAQSQVSRAVAARTRPAADAWHPVVPFIEDDFGRALALAKTRKRPLFIEGWAPW